MPNVANSAYAAFPFPTVRTKIGRAFHIKHGTVTAINGTTLTVQTVNSGTISVLTDSNTKFRRHFWGDSNISEISVGDWVNVKGNWTDDAHTTLQATWVRDGSIAKKFGTFFGSLTSKSDTSFVMQSDSRGTQTVYFDSNTAFKNASGGAITYADIQVGNRVKVKGMWDRKLRKITEVSYVKDLSLTSATASPTTAPTTTQ